MAFYLLRCTETGREQQARLGKQRRDLASVIAARWPDATIALAPGRLVVEAGPDLAAALAEIPGVLSVAPCERVSRDDLEATVIALARRRRPQTFAVRVKRDRRSTSESSLDLARTLTVAITSATGARVDLTRPDVTFGVELRGDTAYVFDTIIPGVERAGPPVPRAPGEPRFVADQMLGRLAARLRLLGYDTLTVFDIADSEVARLAAAEGRVLLTRDGPLSQTQAVAVHRVVATKPQAQLAEVLAALGLAPDPARLFTRCTLCNTPIERVAESAVAARLPPSVRGRSLAIFRCPACDQLYWHGSHVDRILADLAASGVGR